MFHIFAIPIAKPNRAAQIYINVYIYGMIEYEWDEDKRLYNLNRRGLDFNDAWRVYEAENKITLKSTHPHEERLIDMAEVAGRVLLLVYTMRGEAVRCISLRHAKRGKERGLYYGQDR